MKHNLRRIVDRFLGIFNLRLIRATHLREKFSHLPADVLGIVKANSMLNDARLINIIDSVRYVSEAKIGGAFVECGVWKGGSVALMAHSALQCGTSRELYLFDAFDDICQPDARVDGQRAVMEVGGEEFAQGKLQPLTGIYDNKGGAGNESVVLDLMVNGIKYPPERVHILKGWFQETLPRASGSIGKISLLRLDGDWYSSTKVCLDHLYDLVAPGGIVIVDDYACYEGCKKAVDEFLSCRGIRPFFVWVDNECIFWIKTE